MMAACTIFDEDEVCVVSSDKGTVYGLVLENSEYLSSDEDEDEEDTPNRFRRGMVRVAWHPEGKETVLAEEKVILADRSLMPGDVVRRLIKGKDSQRGYVLDMDGHCHLRILGTHKYIINVDTKLLLSLQKFNPDPGDVTLDSWVGKIDAINEEVILAFPDQAKCVISECNLCSFDDVNDKRQMPTEFGVNNFYPGQELRGPMKELSSARWTKPSKKYNSVTVTSKPHMEVYVVVEEVATVSVDVHWVCKGFSKIENPLEKLDPPPELIQGENLAKLRWLGGFEHCSTQLGDKVFYVVRDSDVIETSLMGSDAFAMAWNSLTSLNGVIHRDHAEGSVIMGKEGNSNSIGRSNIDNYVIVDGDEPKGEESENYEDIDSDSDTASTKSGHSGCSHSTSKRKSSMRKGRALHTKFRKKVRGKRAKKKLILPEREVKVGDKVVVEVYYTYSDVTVMWQDGVRESGIPSVNLFPIHHLDELEFFPGDYVIDSIDSGAGTEYGVVVSCDHAGRTCMVKQMKAYDVGKGSRKPTEISEARELSAYDIKDHPYYKFRPGHVVIRVGGYEVSKEQCNDELEAAGIVQELDLQGDILVTWAGGAMSRCYPQELYIVGDDMSEFGSDSEWESTQDDEEDENSEQSWETENEEELDPNSEEVTKLQEEEAANEKTMTAALILDKLVELDKLLQRSQEALESSQEALTKVTGLGENLCVLQGVAGIYQDIIRICKDFDKMWKTTYFDDPKLNGLIGELKREIRKEKSVKISRHLSQLYASWKGEQELSLSKHRDAGISAAGEKLYHGTAGKPIGTENTNSASNQNKCMNGDCDGSQKLEDETPSLSDNYNNFDCEKANCDKNNDTTVKANSDKESTCASRISSEANPCRDDLPMDEINGAAKCDGADCKNENMSLCSEMTADNAAQRLCRNIYTCLKEKMLQVQTELDKVCEIDWAKAPLFPVEPAVFGEKLPSPDTEMETKTTQTTPPSNGTAATDTKCNSMPVGGARKKEEHEVKKLVDVIEGAALPDLTATVNTIIQNFVGQLPCLQAGCIASPVEDSPSMLSRYKEVEDVASPSKDLPQSELVSTAFVMCEEVSVGHKFKLREHVPVKSFMSAVRKELSLLRSSLPEGIIVKAFEDRMDLFSVMIKGPARTPYEDGLFFFDVQLPNEYPMSPPEFHYLSYCRDRLNPNLYEDGKVCVSLLGTWSGKGSEMWTSKSNMLQVLISIQGLILVSEPYYNEAGFEKQRGTQQGLENSKMYNEMAILKLTQSMARIVSHPPAVFQNEARHHVTSTGPRMIQRIEGWIRESERSRSSLPLQQTALPTTPSSANGSIKDCDSSESRQQARPPPLVSTSELTGTDVAQRLTIQNRTDSYSGTTAEKQVESKCEKSAKLTDTQGSSSVEPSRVTGLDIYASRTNRVPSESDTVLSGGCDKPDNISTQLLNPDFPLLPASKGFCITLRKQSNNYKLALRKLSPTSS